MQITIYINTNKFDEFYLHQFHVIYHVGNYFVCGKEEKWEDKNTKIRRKLAGEEKEHEE